MPAATPRPLLRLLTIALWLVFLGGNAFVLAIDLLPGPLPGILGLVMLLILMLCWLALLVRYFRPLGQWRAILALWLGYSLARIAATCANQQDADWFATAFLMIAVYAMFAAWFATLALALRRDVAVAYLAIFLLITPLFFRAQMLAAGGVLAIFQSQRPTTSFSPYTAGETIMLALSCLPTLAFLTFIPHFIWLWVKEWQRQPLPAQPRADPSHLSGLR